MRCVPLAAEGGKWNVTASKVRCPGPLEQATPSPSPSRGKSARSSGDSITGNITSGISAAVWLSRTLVPKNIDNPLGRGAVPQLRHTPYLQRTSELRSHGTLDVARVEADERVGPLIDRRGPLGRGPQRQAAHAEDGRFLLNTAGIGQHKSSVGNEPHELEIPQRLARS